MNTTEAPLAVETPAAAGSCTPSTISTPPGGRAWHWLAAAWPWGRLAAAERRADSIEDRFQRTWARYAIAQAWLRIDPAHAAELADRLEAWTAKRDLLSEVMFAWGQADPQAAGQWGIEFRARTPGDLARRNTALHYAVVGMAEAELPPPAQSKP